MSSQEALGTNDNANIASFLNKTIFSHILSLIYFLLPRKPKNVIIDN